MQLKRLFADDDAVSPVIGVILMVAITVILAAVIGTFVLGLGKNVQSTSPTASITFDQIDDGGTTKVKISHDGGDPLKEGQISIIAPGSPYDTKVDNWGGSDDKEITAGETVTIANGGGGFSSGNTIKVVWTSDGGENSNVLGEYEVQ